MLRRFYIIHLFCFLLFPHWVFSQDLNTYNFSHLGIEDGLSDPYIKCIFQDHLGFMWIGTERGINKYNGKDIEVFLVDHSKEIPLSGIMDIKEDKNRELWVVTENKLLKFDRTTNRFFAPKAIKDRFFFNSILISKSNTIWIPSIGSLLKLKLDSISQITKIDSVIIPDIEIRDLTEDKNGIIWLVTEGNGYFSFNPQTKKLTSYNFVLDKKKNVPLRMARTLSDGTVLLGGYAYGMILIDPVSGKHYHEYFQKTRAYALYNLGIRGVAEEKDKSGNLQLWLSTSNEGIIQYNLKTRKYQTINQLNKPEGLSDNFCRTIFRDRDGNIWVGTIFKGLDIIYKSNQKFKRYYTSEKFTGVEGNVVIAAVPDYQFDLNHTVWCLIYGGGLFRLNTQTYQWTKINIGFPPNTLYSQLCQVRNGKLVFTCKNNSVNYVGIYDPHSNSSKKLSFSRSYPNFNSFEFTSDMLPINDHLAWTGEMKNGIYEINTREGTISRIVDYTYGRIDGLLRINNQEVLFGGFDNDLYKINIITKKIDIIPNIGRLKIQYPSQFTISNSGKIAMSDRFQEIALIFNSDFSIHKELNKNTGLFNEEITACIYDSHENLYLPARSSLITLLNNGTIVRYGLETGWRSIYSLCKPKLYQQYIFTGGSEFVQIINTNDLNHKNLTKGKFVFENLKLADTVFYFSRHKSAMPNQFQYKNNSLQFQYSLLSYYGAKANTYSYRLLGSSPKWIELGNQNKLTLSNLPSGKYTLEIKAKDADGNEVSEILNYSFRIYPPWYFSWWFLSLCFIVTSLIIYKVYRYRIQAIRKEESLKNEMTEMHLSALRSQMNPHFIFNSLNSILNFVLQKDSKQAAYYLNQFASLMRNILDNSVQSKVSIHDEIELLHHYIRLEQLRFDNQFTYQINVEKSINPMEVKIPGMIIQPFVENAIWHGLLHREGKGTLELNFAIKDNKYCCLVTDDGIGRKASKQIKENNRNTYESRGMKITKDRLDALNKGEIKDCYYEIEDLEQGTRVTIYFGKIKN
ncbi:MAG: histidine kinase [Chitinophagales bacterium]|nr:histidine kinase [Chitinophagales bacterium]